MTPLYHAADTLRCVAWAVRPKGAAGPPVCEAYLLTFSYRDAARSDLRLLGTQLLQARVLCTAIVRRSLEQVTTQTSLKHVSLCTLMPATTGCIPYALRCRSIK